MTENITAETFPVCDGCGERHPQMTPQDVYNVAVSVILEEATRIAAETPDAHPRLTEAVQIGEQAASVLLQEKIAQIFGGLADVPAPAQDAPVAPSDGYGLYL